MANQIIKYAVLEHKSNRFITFNEVGYGDGFQETPLFDSKDEAEKFFNHCEDYGDVVPALFKVTFEETC